MPTDRRLRVMVLAGNDDGTAAATSPPTAPVGAIAVSKTLNKKGRAFKGRRAGRR